MKQAAVILICFLVALSIATANVIGDPINQEWRLTSTLNGATAYTLHQGELSLGALGFWASLIPPSFSFDFLSQLRSLHATYGLTERLHVGTTVASNFLGQINLSAKFLAVHLPQTSVSLGIPFSFSFGLQSLSVSTGSGASLSWGISPGVSIHSGFRFSASLNDLRFNGGHLSMAVDLSSNSRLLAGLDIGSQLITFLDEQGDIIKTEIHSYAASSLGVRFRFVFLVYELSLDLSLSGAGVDLFGDSPSVSIGSWAWFRF